MKVEITILKSELNYKRVVRRCAGEYQPCFI